MKMRKKTFSSITASSVKDNIEKFQKFSRGGECIIGSGRCGQHNVKLVRGVTKKKMSNRNKDGTVSWQMREVTILRCPAAQLTGSASKVSATAPLQLGERGTNKKQRISGNDDVDQ